jgi:hypothetical protein
VLPVQLRIGDRLVDETGEPYTREGRWTSSVSTF